MEFVEATAQPAPVMHRHAQGVGTSSWKYAAEFLLLHIAFFLYSGTVLQIQLRQPQQGIQCRPGSVLGLSGFIDVSRRSLNVEESLGDWFINWKTARTSVDWKRKCAGGPWRLQWVRWLFPWMLILFWFYLFLGLCSGCFFFLVYMVIPGSSYQRVQLLPATTRTRMQKIQINRPTFCWCLLHWGMWRFWNWMVGRGIDWGDLRLWLPRKVLKYVQSVSTILIRLLSVTGVLFLFVFTIWCVL